MNSGKNQKLGIDGLTLKEQKHQLAILNLLKIGVELNDDVLKAKLRKTRSADLGP